MQPPLPSDAPAARLSGIVIYIAGVNNKFVVTIHLQCTIQGPLCVNGNNGYITGRERIFIGNKRTINIIIDEAI